MSGAHGLNLLATFDPDEQECTCKTYVSCLLLRDASPMWPQIDVRDLSQQHMNMNMNMIADSSLVINRHISIWSWCLFIVLHVIDEV